MEIHFRKIAPLMGVVLASLGIKLWVIANLPTEQQFDFATYYEIAVNIFQHQGHSLQGMPVAWQGMGYPYFLGFFFRLIGSCSEYSGKMLNVVLSTITLIETYFVYRKLFANKIALWAGVVCTAFFPHFILYNNVLGTEVFFQWLLTTALCIVFYGRRNVATYGILGAFIGFMALTKPFMMAYPAVLMAIHWTGRKKWKETLYFGGILILFMCIVIAPWTLRNYKKYNRFIPISYNGGYVLYINNNDSNIHGMWLDPLTVANDPMVTAGLEEILQYKTIKQAAEAEPILKQGAVRWIRQHPVRFLQLGLLRVEKTFFYGAEDLPMWCMNGLEMPETAEAQLVWRRNINTWQAFFDFCVYTMSVSGFLFCIFSVWKMLRAFFSKQVMSVFSDGFLFFHIAFFVAIHFVFEGQSRYIYPVLPFLIGAWLRIMTLFLQQDSAK